MLRFVGHSAVIQFWQRRTDLSVNEFLPFRPRSAIQSPLPPLRSLVEGRPLVSRLTSLVVHRNRPRPGNRPSFRLTTMTMTTRFPLDWGKRGEGEGIFEIWTIFLPSLFYGTLKAQLAILERIYSEYVSLDLFKYFFDCFVYKFLERRERIFETNWNYGIPDKFGFFGWMYEIFAWKFGAIFLEGNVDWKMLIWNDRWWWWWSFTWCALLNTRTTKKRFVFFFFFFLFALKICKHIYLFIIFSSFFFLAKLMLTFYWNRNMNTLYTTLILTLSTL